MAEVAYHKGVFKGFLRFQRNLTQVVLHLQNEQPKWKDGMVSTTGATAIILILVRNSASLMYL